MQLAMYCNILLAIKSNNTSIISQFFQTLELPVSWPPLVYLERWSAQSTLQLHCHGREAAPLAIWHLPKPFQECMPSLFDKTKDDSIAYAFLN